MAKLGRSWLIFSLLAIPVAAAAITSSWDDAEGASAELSVPVGRIGDVVDYDILSVLRSSDGPDIHREERRTWSIDSLGHTVDQTLRDHPALVVDVARFEVHTTADES